MRKVKVFVKGKISGTLAEVIRGKVYVFDYLDGYDDPEVSRTIPRKEKVYEFGSFPLFFDGCLSK